MVLRTMDTCRLKEKCIIVMEKGSAVTSQKGDVRFILKASGLADLEYRYWFFRVRIARNGLGRFS